MRQTISLFFAIIALHSMAQERIDKPTETFDASSGTITALHWKYDDEIGKWESAPLSLRFCRKTINGQELGFLIEEQTVRLETANHTLTTVYILSKEEFDKIKSAGNDLVIYYFKSVGMNRRSDDPKPTYAEHRFLTRLKQDREPDENGTIVFRRTSSQGQKVLRLALGDTDINREYYEIPDIPIP